MEKGKKRGGDAKKIGRIIISEIIGNKPRKPSSYNLRKIRGEKADIEFCERIDKRISDWEKKADEINKHNSKLSEEDRRLADEFIVPEIPPIILTAKQIYEDFKDAYKILNKVDFNEKNPYSKTDEPLNYVFTLIYYFMRDDRFFKSPLLRKDLSNPSFDKGTVTIGGYGCGKTSTWNSLLYCFRNFTQHVEKVKPSNGSYLLNQYSVNRCVSSDVVDKYDLAKSKFDTENIMRPLMSLHQLYIDDIMREKDANHFGKNNIFLGVLTHRADQSKKTHFSINYVEYMMDGKIKYKNTEQSLQQLRIRYDGRVHDRLFGNYNIIELTGKSFRR